MRSPIPILLLSCFLITNCSNNGDESVVETGTLEATEVTVSSQVSTTVRQMLVDEGSRVTPGDTLAVLDATEWRYQLQQAEANFRATEAQFKLAIEGARKEDVIQAEANFQSAKSDLKRMEDLFASKSVSEKQLEDASTRFTVAQQTLEKLKRGSRVEEIDLVRARRDQAQAQASQLRKKLNDCTIMAPIEGTVITRFVEPGELVAPGSAVVRIADLRHLTVAIYVAETVLPRIRLGQKATVAIDAFKNRSFEADVIYISSTAEFTPKNIQTKDERVKLVFAVKLRVDNPDGTLKAGIPADVSVHLEAAPR